MMTIVTEITLTKEEYLAHEAQAEMRSEYWKGIVIPMPGGTRAHSLIIWNIGFIFLSLQVGREFEVHGDAMRVKVGDNDFAYPDVTVTSGEPLFSKDGGIDNLLNPTVIIEVLSRSTAGFDHNEKFDYYATIPSFQDYLLVSQDKPYVQHYARQSEDRWTRTSYHGLDTIVSLSALSISLPLKAIYKNVDFSAPK